MTDAAITPCAYGRQEPFDTFVGNLIIVPDDYTPVPAGVSYPKERPAIADLAIKWSGERLSISGSFDGSHGQCVDSIRQAFPRSEAVQRLCDVWDEYHLNDMTAGCASQYGNAAFDGGKMLRIYKWTVTTEAFYRSKKIIEEVRDGLINGVSLALSDEDRDLLRAVEAGKMGITTHTKENPDPRYYSPDKGYGTRPLSGYEDKLATWVYQHEHPEGILSKPCPVCGYKYGSKWLTRPVPASALKFLKDLLDSQERLSPIGKCIRAPKG
jgi:hypothetical protein